MPVLTKQLKYFTESPGGQSDDIRQQQRLLKLVFSFLTSHSCGYVIYLRQDSEFPLSQSKMLCSTGGMTKQCYHSGPRFLPMSLLLLFLEKMHALLLEEGYDLGRCREHGYCALFEEKVANVRPWSSLMREAQRVWQLGCRHVEDRSIPDSVWPLLPHQTRGQLVTWNGVMCAAVWAQQEERRGGWGGRVPALLALGPSQGCKHLLLSGP